ncbi:hypothetical protein U713_09615 [Rhodobacter capsulatus YW2]|nr:hypothetical protein U713_09615 [Rhodobacter capsulatus YW2]
MMAPGTRNGRMLHWIFFAVAGAFLVGSFLRTKAGGDPPGEDRTTPGKDED